MSEAELALVGAPVPAVKEGDPASKQPKTLWLRTTIFCRKFGLLLLGFALMLMSFGLETLHRHEANTEPLFAARGVVLAFIGRAVSFVWSALPYLLEHLGVVLIVAGLVRELFEKAHEKEFIGVVNQNLGKTLNETAEKAFVPVQQQIQTLQANLGITIQRKGVLDEKSLEELRDSVLNPKFLRTTYTLDLTLEPYPAPAISTHLSDAYVLVTCRTSYKVKNLTDSPKPYEIKGWMEVMEDAWFPTWIERTRFTRLAFGPIENQEEDRKREFPVVNLQRVSEEALRLNYTLLEEIPADKEFFVELEGKQAMRSQDIFIWNMSALTKALIVNVTLAGGLTPENFQVSAREMHHHQGMESSTTATSYTWKIINTLLPHQGVQIWWSPKTPTTVS